MSGWNICYLLQEVHHVQRKPKTSEVIKIEQAITLNQAIRNCNQYLEEHKGLITAFDISTHLAVAWNITKGQAMDLIVEYRRKKP